jgi:hypothetical protein
MIAFCCVRFGAILTTRDTAEDAAEDAADRHTAASGGAQHRDPIAAQLPTQRPSQSA